MNMKKSFKDLLGRIEHVLEQEGLEDIVLDCVENYDGDGFIVFLSCIYEGVNYQVLKHLGFLFQQDNLLLPQAQE